MTFPMSYRTLDIGAVLETLRRLEARIGERFPESGLRRVAQGALQVADETSAKIRWISAPHRLLRVLIGVVFLLFLFVLFIAARQVRIGIDTMTITELVQTLEAGTNELLLLGLGLYSLFSLERRVKRSRALRSLHELRSMVHVVDMHQLTKDPSRLGNPGQTTASSPTALSSMYELVRYLDYCSELLSLLGKLAAMYAQELDDEVVLDTVSEIESLAAQLSGKIWQKIVIASSLRERG